MERLKIILLLSATLLLTTTIILLYKFRNNRIIQNYNRAIIDTSVLMDGRILEVARAGFGPCQLYIPTSVVGELQHLADMADRTKRKRARYGLDIIHELQKLSTPTTKIIQYDTGALVDDQLIALAKQYGAQLMTIDFNLSKVALTAGITVLNINELAQTLRPILLPGEKTTVKLIRAGESPKQAIGYLDDATLVVVDDAKRYIGNEVEIVCTRVLQTEAGKMIFASIASHKVR